MKLSFKFKPQINSKQIEIIEELSYHTTKLYNIINYELRENGFKNYYEIEEMRLIFEIENNMIINSV